MPKKVILCVDDEKIILTSLKGQFKKHFGGDYHYEFAESAEEAIEVIADLDAENSVILLIVSDWLMPGIRGDEFLIVARQADREAAEQLAERMRQSVSEHVFDLGNGQTANLTCSIGFAFYPFVATRHLQVDRGRDNHNTAQTCIAPAGTLHAGNRQCP